VLFLLIPGLVFAEEISPDRWPAIASACLEAHPEKVTLPVPAAHTERCLERGHAAALCTGQELVSPSVAACIGNTLGQPFQTPARVYVHGPYLEESEESAVSLAYQVIRPLSPRSLRISGWWVDAHTGAVLNEWIGPQANMFTWEPQKGSLPY